MLALASRAMCRYPIAAPDIDPARPQQELIVLKLIFKMVQSTSDIYEEVNHTNLSDASHCRASFAGFGAGVC